MSLPSIYALTSRVKGKSTKRTLLAVYVFAIAKEYKHLNKKMMMQTMDYYAATKNEILMLI